MTKYSVALGLCLALAAASPAAAVAVTDPVGDFLPTYNVALPHTPDLDVTAFSVVFDGTNFLLGATLAGPIVPANGVTYVIGVDTGSGLIHPFADIGEPNVTFNQAVTLTGATGVAALGANTLTSSITGDAFSILVPASLLPSTGVTPAQYGFNLWPRVGFGNNNQISDFAPQNALLRVLAVPEPASWALMLLGFAGVGAAMRRQRRGRPAQVA